MRYLLILLLFSAPVHGQYTVQTDRFTGQVTHSIAGEITGHPSRMARFHAMTIRSGRGTETAIFMVFAHERWRWLTCDPLYWLVDGAPLVVGPHTRQNELTRSGVIEGFLIEVPPSLFEVLSRARTVEIKICNDEMSLPPLTLQYLRQMVEATRTRT